MPEKPPSPAVVKMLIWDTRIFRVGQCPFLMTSGAFPSVLGKMQPQAVKEDWSRAWMLGPSMAGGPLRASAVSTPPLAMSTLIDVETMDEIPSFDVAPPTASASSISETGRRARFS
ncbi:hypothetical protein AMTR_s00034p00180930 [Amborella trichopoda]|uniref:Uncharacterized protein n=1 Tax=Amborella trichopoda TaxID=13333 RepID=W1PWH5_AMBTC|nr:hypothetical protein AMTR_s00034p00180930 [Amborella trichopoda]